MKWLYGVLRSGTATQWQYHTKGEVVDNAREHIDNTLTMQWECHVIFSVHTMLKSLTTSIKLQCQRLCW